MGRRPNPLILEYFERGDKLDDNSNRYNHTCKACNEEFPKGRIESLVIHLTKRCIALSVVDKTKIVLRLHDLGDVDGASQIGTGTSDNPSRGITLPYSPTRPHNFDGLNVLAEASRQVVATEQRQLPPGYTSAAVLQQGQQVPVDPNLEIDPFANGVFSNQGDSLVNRFNGFSMPPATGTALPSLFGYMPIAPQHALPAFSTATDTAISGQAANLSSIAASANETLANVTVPIDPDIEMTSDHDQVSAGLSHGLTAYGGPHMQSHTAVNWQPVGPGAPLNQAQPGDGPIAGAHETLPTQGSADSARLIVFKPSTQPTSFVEESGTRDKIMKPRVRQRFTEDRRKEVQEMRQLGACLRCHIIRKPCSGGDICTVCARITNARVWKLGCIRTRPGKLFTLYSVNLHSTLGMFDLNNVKVAVKFAPYHGEIQVSLVNVGSTTAVFACLAGSPALSQATTGAFRSTTNVYLLDGNPTNLELVMERYLRDIAPSVHAQEDSQVMRPSLALAAKMSAESNDELLREVLDLWTATQVLSSTRLKWHIAVQHLSAPSSPSTVIRAAGHPHSHSLIVSQLRAAVERRASSISTSVMKKIQKRVLKSEPYPTFQTFLLALILLNGVERYSWLFRTWTAPGVVATWPLDTSAGVYAEQGSQFADIMHFMVNLRALTPPTIVGSQDDVLLSGKADDVDATTWLHEVQITPAYLNQLLSGKFDPKNSRSLDGTFFATLFQPYGA